MKDTPKTIMVVEDDQYMSRALQDKFGRSGFKVVAAQDGQKAVEVVRKEKPDIVLLDIMMPKKNGFEILKEIKQDAELQSVPILMLTNLSEESDRKKTFDLGASDYLVKSNTRINEIVEKVKSHIEKGA
jgi:DNA-binding response OmpR family regulator